MTRKVSKATHRKIVSTSLQLRLIEPGHYIRCGCGGCKGWLLVNAVDWDDPGYPILANDSWISSECITAWRTTK